MSCLSGTTPSCDDVQQALDTIDALFVNYYAWFGSMYDRHSGGAYYSSASRGQPHTYPPHIESTSKYTRVLEWSGMIPNTPEIVRDGLVRYIKNRQIGDPNHFYYGFFLDPDYLKLNPADNGASVNIRSAARAAGFSINILNNFGVAPDHPLPNAESNPDALWHLRSATAFRKWLESQNWTRSWSAGGNLLTQATHIQNFSEPRRTEILKTTWDYLENVRQSSENGLWGDQDSESNTPSYILLNGAHKIVSFYVKFDREVPFARELLVRTFSEVKSTPPSNLLHIYNSSQLVRNLRVNAGAVLNEADLATFVNKQAQYLARFLQADGGFSKGASGEDAFEFQPATSVATGNTDIGGLALKARDALYTLVTGSGQPLANANDPRMYAMSGFNARVLAGYHFPEKSLAADIAPGIQASPFGAAGTDPADGPQNDGFSETEVPNRYAISHTGFNNTESFYHFTITPADGPINLTFLALKGRISSAGAETHETIVLMYAPGEKSFGRDFVEAGRTTLGGGDFITRDIPLLTLPDLQDISHPVTFRIHGWNFSTKNRGFQLDSVELYSQ